MSLLLHKKSNLTVGGPFLHSPHTHHSGMSHPKTVPCWSHFFIQLA